VPVLSLYCRFGNRCDDTSVAFVVALIGGDISADVGVDGRGFSNCKPKYSIGAFKKFHNNSHLCFFFNQLRSNGQERIRFGWVHRFYIYFRRIIGIKILFSSQEVSAIAAKIAKSIVKHVSF